MELPKIISDDSKGYSAAWGILSGVSDGTLSSLGFSSDEISQIHDILGKIQAGSASLNEITDGYWIYYKYYGALNAQATGQPISTAPPYPPPYPIPSIPSVAPSVVPSEISEGIPSWVYYAGGAVLVGGVLWYASRKK